MAHHFPAISQNHIRQTNTRPSSGLTSTPSCTNGFINTGIDDSLHGNHIRRIIKADIKPDIIRLNTSITM
jgi:hypothetical protein